jgi:zinc protease
LIFAGGESSRPADDRAQPLGRPKGISGPLRLRGSFPIAAAKRGFAALLALALLWPSFAAAGPKIESWQTPNGARVLFVAASELPMVDVRVVFDAGSARDGSRPGLASLTNELLTEGAGPWSADELAARVDSVGASLGSDSLRDMAYVSIRSLTEPKALEVAIETLAAVVAAPRFEPGDIERLRNARLVSLRQQEQSAGSVASKAFYRTLYGEHPYATDPDGTPESVAAVTRAELQEFHRRYYVGNNAVVAIVGALDRTQAEALAQRVTAGVPAGERPAKVAEPSPPAPGEHPMAFPSTQTHIYLGQLGMARHDPDYFPLLVGNHVLGSSGLVSLLGEEVRNKRGLSYSVYSGLLPMRQTGPFMAVAQTKNSQTAAALAVIRQTIADFVASGPTAKDLDEAKRNLTGGFPLRIASNGKIVEQLAVIGFYDYPLDWLDTYVAKVDAVTVEQVRDAFRRRIDPNRAIVVVVGGDQAAPSGG